MKAGMLEGGERTPMLNPVELEEIGSMLVSYPIYLIGISISTLEVGVEQVIPYQWQKLWKPSLRLQQQPFEAEDCCSWSVCSLCRSHFGKLRLLHKMQ
uniref:Uncharacterized protein n=1 Tax=Musa acuminata subsp. malaccensis TaxID=214687 RepID=A0A804KSD5_MUSAM|nr:PREDICTED: uncharacterized protein LOC103999950 isoform X2 [Musa acuminata subsp. malaccensis]